MRTYYRSLADVLGSPLVRAAKASGRKDAGEHRVLRSTRLEDAIYQDLRRGDDALDALEKTCGEKLSTFSALSRDIYQSFYSLNVRKNDAQALSETAKRFNSPILEEVMGGEDYPTIKAACEGRQLPAYEVAGEFVSQVAENLDGLLERAGGDKNALDTLERLEQKRDQSMEQLRRLLERLEQSGDDPALEKQVVAAANRAQSQANQADAVGRMVRDNMLKSKESISALVAAAGRAAAKKAEDAAAVLMAWGTGPESGDAKTMQADMQLVERVRQSGALLEIARHLGRLKELMEGKRKNGYAYGRGEKYSLEQGRDLSRTLASEFALLATPQTIPLFLRKLQRGGLKQYLRREPVCKGSGDIICMLDESGSAEADAPWCKAVALALLDIAMRGQRRFAMIHFSSQGKYHTDLFLPGQYGREDVLRAAELFLDGNTDYATPLREGLRLMEQEGFENADMVFVTDGACRLPEDFLAELKEKQASLGFHITGVLLDQNATGFPFSLEPFCGEILRTSQLAQEQIAERILCQRL